MKKSERKIIVILGQTSTGKSDFAVEIAKHVNGEIISADSRQVYKGMNLGTGKITKKEMHGVPHHLLDVVSPTKIFSASDFQKLATQKINEIFSRGKVPIICGGTGFYIDSIINNSIFPSVPPNKKLRAKLEKLSLIELNQYLEKLDPSRLETIDKNNPVRLIRAIEIAQALGSVPNFSAKTLLAENKYDVLKIGLTLPPEILKERIKKRLLARLKKGMLKEIENLHKEGLSWKRMESLGLEYRYGALYLQNLSRRAKAGKKKRFTPSLASDRVKMIEKINTESWHYAKRQKTWFKRDPNIIWINPTINKDKQLILKQIKKFLG